MSQDTSIEPTETTEGEGPPPPRSVGARVETFVGRRVSSLQKQYTQQRPTSYSRAVLAQLRRGVGKPIGELPELLEFVIDPDAPAPPGDGPSADEIAAYTAITLYAVHQQSQPKPMHRPGHSFGTAIGSLRFSGSEENQGVTRRFQALGTASGMEELVHHARGLVTLLRSADRGFDYGRFARDLLDYQNPYRVDRVRLAWGRDFYRVATPSPATTETEEQS